MKFKCNGKIKLNTFKWCFNLLLDSLFLGLVTAKKCQNGTLIKPNKAINLKKSGTIWFPLVETNSY